MKSLVCVILVTAATWAQSALSGTSNQQNGSWPASSSAAPVLVSIITTPATPTQLVGSATPFSATGTFSDGSTQDITQSTTWSTGNPAVAVFGALGPQQSVSCVGAGTSLISASQGSVAGSTTLACVVSGASTGCGTDVNGVPTDDSQCGVSGTNAYMGEGTGVTTLAQWCGGILPGNCTAINASTCPIVLAAGTNVSHNKYYLTGNLNCGGSSLAFLAAKYVDFNLNGFTITGAVFLNGSLKGFHFFNGTVNCNISSAANLGNSNFTFGCLDNENNTGTYTQGGGDQIRVHHIIGQNFNGATYFIRFTGEMSAPSGGFTEPVILFYNNTCQSVPETTSARQHACVYAQTQPVEYYNNSGDVGASGTASATQLLEVYGPSSNGTFPNYFHNNYLTCEPFAFGPGDTCRPILCDGGLACHVQYNDIYPTNSRCIRLRDAFNAEVDHNYCHGLLSVYGFTGVGTHTGDNDIHSGQGQNVPINIHDNTFELGPGGWGHFERSQQGTVSESNTYLCAAGGCAGSIIFSVSATDGSFCAHGSVPCTVTVDPVASTLTQSSGSFLIGTSIKVGSALTFSRFTNAGNNVQCTVTAISPTVMTVGSCTGPGLVSESSTTAHSGGVTAANLQNFTFTGVSSTVNVNQQTTTGPSATLNFCPGGLTNLGNGTLSPIGGTCP